MKWPSLQKIEKLIGLVAPLALPVLFENIRLGFKMCTHVKTLDKYTSKLRE
jgi:hypothetical protein